LEDDSIQCHFGYLPRRRATLRHPNLPNEFPIEQRALDVANILATGILRWHQSRVPEIRACPDSSPPGLEHVADTVLTVVNPDNVPDTTAFSEGESE
jgi:hypothetical protein